MVQRQRSAARAPATPVAPAPSWTVAGLALLGLAVSAYLTWLKLTGNAALFCRPGSGCEAVQSSRYGTFLWVPTAAWGAVFYAVIAALALWGLSLTRWRIAFLLAAAGVGFSIYLTALSVFAVHATCPYCLLSTAIALVLLALLVWQKPAGSRRHWGPLVVQGVLSAGAAVLFGAFVFAGQLETSPEQLALARHLADTKAVMYGAYWCPHCQEQKARFGGAASAVPYVECDPSGAKARPDLCARADVRVYPTWVIAGQRHEGVLSLDELARLSKFSPAPAATR